MTPYYADDWLTVWQGDCREVMAQMPAESVHTVVTSPPYWGLRDYGEGQIGAWGGDPGHDHEWKAHARRVNNRHAHALREGLDTGRVAQRLGRRAVLIDLSGDYLVQAMERNREIPLGLESA